MSDVATQSSSGIRSRDRGPVLFAAFALAASITITAIVVDLRQASLFLIGALLGVALYHGAFGFTGGWRRFAVERRGRHFRAQLMMIGAATIVFIPLLAIGTLFGQSLIGAVAPVGVSVLVGAILFGVGMQLGGGCGSGTLFTVGGGNARMLVTLLFFMVGALIGSAHLPYWLQLPSLPAMSLGSLFGPIGGIGATLAGLGLIALISVYVEKRKHGRLEPEPVYPKTTMSELLVRGPWPLVWTGLVLAALNVATLLTAGHPWSITFGFGLWAAKIGQGLGLPVASWEFWTWPGPSEALHQGVLHDVTSVMNFGILLGAAFAAALAGRFAPKAEIPIASIVAAALGGLLMGYGARLSFGCNIGALFSGIASGSLHGWLWFVAAFCGSLVGIRLRPVFGLDGYKPK